MLSERQQRRLEEIERNLRASDGLLAGRFSLFAELVRDQEMPRREELPLTLRQRMARLGRYATLGPQPDGPLWPPRALLLLPALMAAITCALLLAAVPSRSGAGCATPQGHASAATQNVPGQPPEWPAGCVYRHPSPRHH